MRSWQEIRDQDDRDRASRRRSELSSDYQNALEAERQARDAADDYSRADRPSPEMVKHLEAHTMRAHLALSEAG